jgi:hypothetical protein
MLKKASAFAPLLVLLVWASVSAQQPGAAWEKFNSPEGRFNVLMPAKPALETKEVDSPVGKLTLYAYSASNKTGYFLTSFGDYPVEPKDAANVETVLDAVQSGVLKGIEAEASPGAKKISLGAYSGREFSAKKEMQGMKVVFNWRIYLAGRRLYQLAVVTEETVTPSPQIAKFFTSFDITK